MADAAILAVFDEIYESTYRKTLAYITRRCGKAEDIADILQETYAETYCILVRKGMDYMISPEAFVLRVARTKVHRHYTLFEKMKAMIPLTARSEDGEEYDIAELECPGPSIEDQLVDHLFLDDVVRCIRDKPSCVQRAIFLHYGLDLPMSQVAAELHTNESTVKSWIYRAVRDVRRRMEAEGAKQ